MPAAKPPSRASRADRHLLMIRYMKVMSMAKPRKVSMAVSPGGAARGRVSAGHSSGGERVWGGRSGWGHGAWQSPFCCRDWPGSVQDAAPEQAGLVPAVG